MLDPFSGKPASHSCSNLPNIPVKSYSHRPPTQDHAGYKQLNNRLNGLFERLAALDEKLKYIEQTKVDIQPNKGLSTEDFTTAHKEKLETLSDTPKWSISEW